MYSAFSGFSKLVVLGIGVIGLFFGIASWPSDSEMLAKASDSMHWPSASATIRSVDVESHEEHNRSGTYYTYKCNVTYEYKIGGKRFAGTRISYATAADHLVRDKSVVDAVADTFRLNSKHPVRYNPRNRGDAVLVPGVDPDNVSLTSYMAGFIGLLFLLLAAARAVCDDGSSYSHYPSNSSFASIPIILLGALIFFMQPTFIRHIVPPSAVVAPFK